MRITFDAFMASPSEASFRGEQVWVWHRPPDLWSTVIWSRPTEDDVKQMTAVWDFALQPSAPAQFISLVDCRRISGVDPDAFEVLSRYMRDHATAFHARLRRQALLRPAGVVGSIVGGFFGLLSYALPVKVFTDPASAYAWLLDRDAPDVVAEFEARCDAGADATRTTLALRAALARNPGASDLKSVARLLGLSTRSLQRQLADRGTSFRDEVHRARIEKARDLLVQTDRKLAAIGASVGYTTPSAFASAFRRLTGASPQQWRDTHRK